MRGTPAGYGVPRGHVHCAWSCIGLAITMVSLPCVVTATPPPRASVIAVDDFDGEPNTLNNMLGPRELLHGGCGDELSIVSQSLSGNALKLFYNHTTCDSGWTTRLDGQSGLHPRDLSDAIALRFHTRGVVSSTRFRVELEDANGATATADVVGVLSAWSERTIDVSAFAGVDLSRLTRLAFVLPRDYSDDLDGKGSLYFDNLYFQTAAAEPVDEAALLAEMARRCFRYFWGLANPNTGFAPDRATNETVTSIAGVGYQLASLPIGVTHGWVGREAAAARARQVLETLATNPQRPDGSVADENAYIGRWGFFYHMLDSDTGLRVWNSELSTIDSTLCLLGVINARVFFDGPSVDEADVRSYADFILDRVDWPFMYYGPSNYIWMEWRPETGLGGFWDTYTDETITMTLLAVASRTNPLPPSVFYAWNREQRHYGGYAAYASITGTQFTYYQAHGWLDLKGRTDRHARTPVSWLRNSWAASRAERAFAIDKSGTFATYGPDAWGVSDSSVPGAPYYSPRGQPRLSGEADNDNGTIPCAAAGSTLAFFHGDPDGNLALDALRHYYEDFDNAVGIPRLWKIYGPVDAYNDAVSPGWYSNEFICLGQGALLLAIENDLSNDAVGRRTGSFEPLADAMDAVMWPAWDIHDVIYAREAEGWDAHSAGPGMENEYHPEASGNWTFQLGTAAGNNVQYDVRNYWTPGEIYSLEIGYSEDVPGNVIAIEWDGQEIGRFTTQYSGGWLSFITSPRFAFGPIEAGDHHLRLVNVNGGTYGVNVDVVRVYSRYERGDIDNDGDVDSADHVLFASCMSGPDASAIPPGCPEATFHGSDLDRDFDVDLADFDRFARALDEQ